MGSVNSTEMDAWELGYAPSSDNESSDDDDDLWESLCDDEYCFEDDDDLDEGLQERLRILEDCRKLKKLAEFFLHPEKPIQADAAARGRCYFDRSSAPQQTSLEDSNEAIRILDEARAIKKLVVDYRHPEVPVTNSDATSYARCYFERASAPQQDWNEEEHEERARIFADLRLLKEAASTYLHPEAPIGKANPTQFGRLFFIRPSAPEQSTLEEEEEKTLILEDAALLKRAAIDFRHPETALEVDATACARNYFTRPSAPEQASEDDKEEEEEEEEHLMILKDAALLKQAATDFRHPERPLGVDAAASARNYFTRPSAPEQVGEDDEEERLMILKEAALMKQAAIDFRHPERPVLVDPAALGRNYFTRPSAPEQASEDDEEEHLMILKEAALMKQAAIDFRHPEKPLEVGATASARNYFTRPFAPEQPSEDDEEERLMILKEAALMKQAAIDFRHPERPVAVDATASARNYFTRPSAPEPASEDDEEERLMILKEAALMKQAAIDFRHPERPVAVDATAGARNYFTRPSAPEPASEDDEEERLMILKEAALMKQAAIDFRHPERPVLVDPAALGRNYFTRPSACEHDYDEEERQDILKDCEASKKQAKDFLHPELPVDTDPSTFGRNYFSRPSAPEQVDEEERERILDHARALKKLAIDFLHPELPVEINPTRAARNFFHRPSAPLSHEDFKHRAVDYLKHLKDRAVWYLHPSASGSNSSEAFDIPKKEDEEELHFHHLHFDMDDDVHLHHVEFDRNTDHHDEITEVRVTTPTVTTRPVINDFDFKLSMSPGCVMTLTHPKELDLPQMMDRA